MSEHTPGPWTQGRTLRTAQTRRWSPEKMERSDKIERRYVYARFSEEDQGLSRIFVASCESEADAQAISATLDLLAVVEEAIRLYGKPGGPWNVPSDPGGWIARAQDAVAKARGGTQ